MRHIPIHGLRQKVSGFHKDITTAPTCDVDGIISDIGKDVDGSTIQKEERAVMMKILNRSKLIKTARKGRMPEKLD